MKIVRAKCSKTNKRLCLQVSDNASEVRGCFKVSDGEFESTPSQIRIAPNAVCPKVSCTKCGSNKAFGCEHTYASMRCNDRQNAPDRMCLTCKYLVPDYAKSRGGGEIQLKAGEVAELTLSKIRVGMGWGPGIDIDSSVVLVQSDGETECVSFRHLNSEDGSVHHHGDNLVGADGCVPGVNDAETIDIHLDKVNRRYNRLVIVLNVYTSSRAFRDVDNLYIVVCNAETNERLIIYRVEQQRSTDTAMIVAQVTRGYDGWQFKAIGECQKMRLDDLEEYCSRKVW